MGKKRKSSNGIVYSDFSRVKSSRITLLAQLMSKQYKGFITRSKFKELRDKLQSILRFDGLENQLCHMNQPDTDMEDQICEKFEDQKHFLIYNLLKVCSDLGHFMEEIRNLSEEK